MIKAIQATHGIKQRIREQWIGMSNNKKRTEREKT